MEIITFKMQKIKASEGMVLTNGEAYSDIGGEVYLGKNDTVESWREITGEEYGEIMRARAEEEKI